ncbi:MAG: aminoacyl-tRNA hydrolase [Flavobacteriales bacterium]|nr:aminoacyl-tRNA hydrolase [Flavobacteriales bacterium]
MKYLIAGLGNIGPEYHDTRHNIGFSVLDELCATQEIKMEPGRYGDLAKYKFKGRTLILLKPSTYMNLSGNAVRYWLKKESIKDQNLLVITDDIALPFGKLRMRKKGSHGGHNGLKHIEQILGHSAYNRIRFGVGNDFSRGQQVDYVLGKWEEKEKKDLEKPIKKAIDMIRAFSTIGIDRAMNQYN